MLGITPLYCSPLTVIGPDSPNSAAVSTFSRSPSRKSDFASGGKRAFQAAAIRLVTGCTVGIVDGFTLAP